MGQVIPLRLSEEELMRIDMLVKMGVFSSRSEALRELIRLGIKNLEDIINMVQAVDKLFKLEKEEGDIPIKLPHIAKQLLVERDRFP